jgi:hypothetical protein
MKYYVFVDNFRGFSDTCIPIADVNFLVGENSTGKTSFLGLLKLLAGPRFFFRQGFDSEHIGFGFSDIVSAHSDNRSYFRIGFVWEELQGKKGKAVVTGCLLTFEEEEGLPKLAKCTFCRGGNKISLRLGNDVYYREEKCGSLSPQQVVSSLRSQWVNEHSERDSKYTKLVLPPALGRGLPILVMLSFILGGTKRNKKKQHELFVYPPDIDFLPELTWLAPIRTKTKRTYDQLTQELFSPEGAHTPYLIRRMLRSRSKASALKFRDFIERVGKTSGLFQDVRIRNFGRGANVPFELDIVLDGKALNVNNVGYGVSQALPVLVEVLARPQGTWFAIQQPEVHLHPRAQATLGDVFFELAVQDNKRFLVETHSDFTLDRFRMNYKKSRVTKPDSQILFFERQNKHNTITPMVIGKTGELPTDQPESYRKFFIREQMNMLEI